MTVETTTNKVIFIGNDATTIFTYSFVIPTAESVVLLYTDTDGVQTNIPPSRYGITGIGDPDGGTLTYPLSGSPIAAQTSLTLMRIVPLVQTTDLVNQGGYYPSVVEGEFDYQMEAIQQINEVQDRTIRGNPADPDSTSYELPTIAQRAGNVLGFDSDGNPVAVAGVLEGVTVSGPMVPVVEAATTADALVAMGAFPTAGGEVTGDTTFDSDVTILGTLTVNGATIQQSQPWSALRQWAGITDGTYQVGAPNYAFIVDTMVYNVGSGGGSFDVTLQINGVSVTGIAGVAVSSSSDNTATATATNTGTAQQKITAVISSTASSPAGSYIIVYGRRVYS